VATVQWLRQRLDTCSGCYLHRQFQRKSVCLLPLRTPTRLVGFGNEPFPTQRPQLSSVEQWPSTAEGISSIGLPEHNRLSRSLEPPTVETEQLASMLKIQTPSVIDTLDAS
jgi:hypothetical protein